MKKFLIIISVIAAIVTIVVLIKKKIIIIGKPKTASEEFVDSLEKVTGFNLGQFKGRGPEGPIFN